MSIWNKIGFNRSEETNQFRDSGHPSLKNQEKWNILSHMRQSDTCSAAENVGTLQLFPNHWVPAEARQKPMIDMQATSTNEVKQVLD